MTPQTPADGTTFGVESEYRTYSASMLRESSDALRLTDVAGASISFDAAEVEFHPEAHTSVFELVSGVCTIEEMPAVLASMGLAAIQATESVDCFPLDYGMPLHAEHLMLETTPNRRYQRTREEVGELTPNTGVHLHVNVEDPDKRVEVRDRMSAYEHLLIALTAGTPIAYGVHGRRASIRVDEWHLRKTFLDPRWHGNYEAHLDELRVHLKAIGMYETDKIPDGLPIEPYVFRYAYPWTRISTDGKPTLEVRAFDAPLTMDDKLFCVYLGAALANRVIMDVEDGLAPFAQPDVHIHHPAMRKTAVVHGMSKRLLDPASLELRPAWDVADSFFEYLRPALERLNIVDEFFALAAGMKARGTAAERIHRLHASIHDRRSQSQQDVVDRELWERGFQPMTEGTGRHLVSAVLMENWFGTLYADKTDELERLAMTFTCEPESRNEIAAMAVQRLEKSLSQR